MSAFSGLAQAGAGKGGGSCAHGLCWGAAPRSGPLPTAMCTLLAGRLPLGCKETSSRLTPPPSVLGRAAGGLVRCGQLPVLGARPHAGGHLLLPLPHGRELPPAGGAGRAGAGGGLLGCAFFPQSLCRAAMPSSAPNVPSSVPSAECSASTGADPLQQAEQLPPTPPALLPACPPRRRTLPSPARCRTTPCTPSSRSRAPASATPALTPWVGDIRNRGGKLGSALCCPQGVASGVAALSVPRWTYFQALQMCDTFC